LVLGLGLTYDIVAFGYSGPESVSSVLSSLHDIPVPSHPIGL